MEIEKEEIKERKEFQKFLKEKDLDVSPLFDLDGETCHSVINIGFSKDSGLVFQSYGNYSLYEIIGILEELKNDLLNDSNLNGGGNNGKTLYK